MTIVVADGVGVAFRDAARPALEAVDLVVGEGEVVAVVGATGAGKSTFARLLVGLIPGHVPAEVRGRLTRPDVVGYVPERAEAALIEPRVGDDVGLGLPIDGRAERVAEALVSVGLVGFEGRATGELSGGQVQRVAIAGALARGAELLVLDDPTSELDADGRAALLCALDGRTAVVATHDPYLVEGCTRVVALDRGTVAYDGSPSALIADPEACRRIGLRTTRGEPLRVRIGAPPPPVSGELVARVAHLDFAYPGGIVALDDVSLEVSRGEIVALRGANGAGKSTLARCLLGLLPTPDGTVAVEGTVAMVLQDPDTQLFHDTVGAEVGFAPRCQALVPEAVEERVARAMAAVGIADDAHTHPLRLARSRRQLVAVAGALAAEPDLLILDEPTGGLDRDAFERVAGAVVDAADRGAGVLLITHDDDLASLATRTVTLTAPPLAPSNTQGEPPRTRRWDVRAVAGATFLSMGLMVSGSWPVVAAVLAIGLVLLATTVPRGLRGAGSALLPLAPVAVFVGVFGYLVPPGWVNDPATYATLLVLRLAGMVIWTVWALAKGDGEQGIALARASRLPPSLVLVVTIALRFVPTLTRRRERIALAQRARGARLDEGGPIRRARAQLVVLVPLFVGAIATANDLAAALTVRGVGTDAEPDTAR
ncbi:MAG: ATP-binding cassette domain-containing protein [Tessaracoccus sp.]|uniref:ATP-binding cassette domain-containing protein n=1 Tax=Tessaracoccus sp. TaxID=1971211 RepID=UPI001EB44385|nr:ATP-binding cassette domain-containing protein [Tessaracoccus sp.]MBK7820745.1 ATP-binding cassette domain-containing protein [Tessaracoccus sp.]